MTIYLKGKTRKEVYDEIYQRAEDILVASGVKKECIKCSQKKYGGCCSGCKYLNEKGCTVKALGCKLWLCSERLNEFSIMIKKIGKLEEFNMLINIAESGGMIDYREPYSANTTYWDMPKLIDVPVNKPTNK